MSDSKHDQLLHILEAHGEAFLSSFYLEDSSRKRKSCATQDQGEEEWQGVGIDVVERSSVADTVPEIDLQTTSVDTGLKNSTVFSDLPESITSKELSRGQMKAFMSPNIRKSRGPGAQSIQSVREPLTNDDLSNAQNDAILHKLIHTKLLSSSSKGLDLPPAKKQKALAGRLLELAGHVRIGKGENQTRETERKKAAKNVREGIVRKQQEREKQRLNEAKNFGNYHPTLKAVFEPSLKESIRKRKCGLRMGVGNFSNGCLHLRKDDFSLATNSVKYKGHHSKRPR